MSIHYKETKYGFDYGAAQIERCCSDEKKGWVVLLVKTPRHPLGIELSITKSGKVRIHSLNKKTAKMQEWKP